MSSTDLYEHMGNIQIKGWDLYHHNIGLKSLPKYKTGFVVKTAPRTLQMYGAGGALISTMISSQDFNSEGVIPIPSKGIILIRSQVSNTFYIELFNGNTGEKVVSWTLIGSGSLPSVDVFENGDIFISHNGNVYYYNIKGELKETLTRMGSNIVKTHSKRRLVALFDVSSNSYLSIYDKATITSKVPKIPRFQTTYTFRALLNDGVIESINNGAYVMHREIDFSSGQIVNSNQINIGAPGYTQNFIRDFKEKAYFLRSSTTTTNNTKFLVEVDGEIPEVITYPLPSITNIHDIDNQFILASDSSSYKIYSRQDNSLLYTIPSTLAVSSKIALSTKGSYANFQNYW